MKPNGHLYSIIAIQREIVTANSINLRCNRKNKSLEKEFGKEGHSQPWRQCILQKLGLRWRFAPTARLIQLCQQLRQQMCQFHLKYQRIDNNFLCVWSNTPTTRKGKAMQSQHYLLHIKFRYLEVLHKNLLQEIW